MHPVLGQPSAVRLLFRVLVVLVQAPPDLLESSWALLEHATRACKYTQKLSALDKAEGGTCDLS